ncbi:MAG: A/G-specific adenine glycosylase [Thermoplasmata archaeon]
MLAWYDRSRRDLPWRRTRDPYRILVAEFLLQRTRIASGTPYYERFIARFPTVGDLAAASLDDVLSMWEGLGFYGRARNLHAAARTIVERHGSEVPRSYEALMALPGIGPYTAGAVASIAFGIAVPAVDGNVLRVMARLWRIRDDVTAAPVRRRITKLAARLVPSDAPGAFNQAVMELGATICTPTSPACDRCPLASLCLARLAGEEREIPVARERKPPRVVPVAFALIESKGRVLLVRRDAGELLGGLWALPGGEMPSKGSERRSLPARVREQTGFEVDVGSRWSPVERTFSHRKWSGWIYRCPPRRRARAHGNVRWIPISEALRLPLVPFHREALRSLAGLESFAHR